MTLLKTGPRLRAWARRHVVWLVVGAVFAGTMAYVVAGSLQEPRDTATLSVRNPSPSGAMALAAVLDRNGVKVTASDSWSATSQALTDGTGTTVLLYDPKGYLDDGKLRALVREARHVVVVAPRLRTLSGLGGSIRQGGVVPDGTGTLEPGCGLRAAEAAGRIAADGFAYTGPETCYRVRTDGPGMVAGTSDGQLLVIGNPALLGNGLLDEEGHAALALHALGKDRNLLWYTPGLGDVPASDTPPSLSELAPAWLAFMGPWLGFVALLAILWRGRRLGPLVFEPLPVVVKAVETAEGRARLYQDAGAVDRAADNLRAGSLTRLARHFGLGSGTDARSVADAAARRLDVPVQEISAVLLDARPQSEGELVRWAQQLEKLEQEATTR